MIPAIHTALSGLAAFSTRLDVAARNLANLDTDGFRRSRAVLHEIASGGVGTRIETPATPGARVLVRSAEGPVLVEKSNVDVGAELVDVLTAERSYEANLEVVRTADELVGGLLDTLAR